MMKLAVGPCLFEWGRKGVQDFYRRMAEETEADILYVGEVVCSKRMLLSPKEMEALGTALKASGKEVVFCTFALVMNEGELDYLKQIMGIAQGLGIKVEVNDLAGLAEGEGKAMVAGPHITTYNPETLQFLSRVGVQRAVLPVELSKKHMSGIIADHGVKGMEVEVFAFGKLPLAFSARCYTARHFNIPKSDCRYKCGDFPDGLTIRTQDGLDFLTMNGIQTMSDRLYNLVDRVEDVKKMGAHIIRLSPQSQNMGRIIDVFRQRLNGRMDAKEALAKMDDLTGHVGFCNGYYHGRAGLEWVK